MTLKELYNKADYKDNMGMCFKGDCLEVMKDIPDGSVDLILTDPPYGTTACKWDSIIPFNDYVIINNKKYQYEECILNNKIMKEFDYDILKFRDYFDNNKQIGMWTELNRIIKSNGTICLFGSEPFSSALRMSNIKNYKYDLYWVKEKPTNFMQLKKRFGKLTENICIFYDGKCNYYPQMVEYNGKKVTNKPSEKNAKFKSIVASNSNSQILPYTDNGYRYPCDILKFNRCKLGTTLHPTQKPIELLELLIKSYTIENETVFDFTMGSGSTCVACKNTNRKYIGIELDDKYFDIACDRLKGE